MNAFILKNTLFHWIKSRLEITHGNHPSMYSMEGLRGIAVFLVFWVHYSSLIERWLSGTTVIVSNFILEMGHLGVDLFFVLSGYLIYGSITNKSIFAPLKYIKRRAQRIYPAFLAVFVLYLLLSLLFPNESKLPSSTINAIIYVIQNILFLPGLFNIEPVITVAWSLSYEVFYYISVPIVIFTLRLKQWTSDERVVFWCLIAGIGFSYFYLYGGPIRLLMFIAGILVYELYTVKQIKINRFGSIYLIAALLLFGFRSIYTFNYPMSVLAVFVLFTLLCLCAFNKNTGIYRWLTFQPLRWLGNMSYSYYLIHGLTLKFVFLALGFLLPADYTNNLLYYWLWIPALIATLVASFLLYISVEKPFSLTIHGNKR